MKKTSILILLFTLYLISFLTFTSSKINATMSTAVTFNTSPSIDVQINHFIEIRDGGLILVNDTVELSPKPGENPTLISNFLIGFPFDYGKKEPFGGATYQIAKERFYPDYCFAFDSQGELEVLSDVGLGKLGFYGVNVIFTQPVNISSGHSYSFTIVFAFSNLLQTSISASDPSRVEWNATIPLYPSMIQDASSCVVKIFLPKNATYKTQSSSLYEKSLLADTPKDFNVTLSSSRQILNITQSPLLDFTYESGWLVFTQPQILSNLLLTLEANEIIREITLDTLGRIFCSESYSITNRGAVDVTSLKIRVPQDAYDFSAQDRTGNLVVSAQRGSTNVPTNASISFVVPIQKNVKATFTFMYWLSSRNYVNQYSWRDYILSFAFFERQNFDWVIRKLTTTIILPEGADFVKLPTLPENFRLKTYSSLQKNAFQEILTFSFYNITPFHSLDFSLSYGYLIFWASFRPTLWMGTIVAVICVAALLWKLPKRPEIPITPVPSKDLRSFVETYEKKTGILTELMQMEEQLQKSKIPRRKYKVRRETLEGRLNMLSRDLTGLKEKLRRSGAKYANIIGQIEVNETELDGLEADVRRVEGRYERGEISKGAYLRLLEEYHRRRDRARVTIDGVLLRLKEEIS